MIKGVFGAAVICVLAGCGSPEPPLQLSDAYIQHTMDGERSKFSKQVEHAVAKRNLDCKKAIRIGM